MENERNREKYKQSHTSGKCFKMILASDFLIRFIYVCLLHLQIFCAALTNQNIVLPTGDGLAPAALGLHLPHLILGSLVSIPGTILQAGDTVHLNICSTTMRKEVYFPATHLPTNSSLTRKSSILLNSTTSNCFPTLFLIWVGQKKFHLQSDTLMQST